MSDQLLPCPFCGKTDTHFDSEYGYQVICDCGARGPSCWDEKSTIDEDEAGAVKLWNTRYPGWKKYPDEEPDDQQEVLFVAIDQHNSHFNGRVFGGKYSKGWGFSLPGQCCSASFWLPMTYPPIPTEEKNELEKVCG